MVATGDHGGHGLGTFLSLVAQHIRCTVDAAESQRNHGKRHALALGFRPANKTLRIEASCEELRAKGACRNQKQKA